MKKLLLVIDYQHDFIDGSLGFQKAPLLAEGIKRLIQSFRDAKDDIIFTMDTHHFDYLTTQEGTILPVVHCIENTQGHEIYQTLKEVMKKEDVIFKKPTFGSLELGNYLKDKSYGVIEIVGLVTNICVISNAIIAKSALPEAKIIIHRNLCASFSDELHEKALDVMESLHIYIVD
jgi:nicotinamidase/pyrazinamidase